MVGRGVGGSSWPKDLSLDPPRIEDFIRHLQIANEVASTSGVPQSYLFSRANRLEVSQRPPPIC